MIYIFVDVAMPNGVVMLPPKAVGYLTNPPASGMGNLLLICWSEISKTI